MTHVIKTAEAVALTRLPRHRLWQAVRSKLLPRPLKIHHKLVMWDRASVVEFAALCRKVASNDHAAAKKLAAKLARADKAVARADAREVV